MPNDAQPPKRKKRGLLKRFLRSSWAARMLRWVGVAYIRLCYHTSRWQTIAGEIPAAYWDRGQPFIFAFWHGRLLMMPHLWNPQRPLHMLISNHRDGRLISAIVAHYGIRTVVSASSSGSRGFRTLLRILQAGHCVGITPDGPRGPAMQAQAGVIQAARLTGTPIIPASYGVRRRRILGSWDSFLLPLPFTRGVFAWGQPIEIPRDADEQAQEAARLQLAAALNQLTATVDRACGHAPME